MAMAKKKQQGGATGSGTSVLVTVVASAAALGAGVLLGRTILAPSESKPTTANSARAPAGQVDLELYPLAEGFTLSKEAATPQVLGSSEVTAARVSPDLEMQARLLLAAEGVDCAWWMRLSPDLKLSLLARSVPAVSAAARGWGLATDMTSLDALAEIVDQYCRSTTGGGAPVPVRTSLKAFAPQAQVLTASTVAPAVLPGFAAAQQAGLTGGWRKR